MGADYLIGEVSRRRGEVLRVSLREYKSRLYADVRIHFPSEAGVFEPSRKGLMLAPQDLHALLPLLSRATALLGGKMLCGADVPAPEPDEAGLDDPPPEPAPATVNGHGSAEGLSYPRDRAGGDGKRVVRDRDGTLRVVVRESAS